MKVAAVGSRGDDAGTDDEFAEALAMLSLRGIGRKQRIERVDDARVIQIFRIKLGQARAVEGGAEIKIVPAWPFAHEADFGEIGASTPVRATRHADDDLVLSKAVRSEAFFERGHEARQVAFALGERESAGR